MKKSIKLICLTGCMIFALALLSGCSLFGPKSAEDVIEKYSKVQEKIENFNMKGTIDMTETLTTDNAEVQAALGTNKIEIPIEMDLDMDAGKETAHGDVDVKMSYSGESYNTEIEMYVDAKDGYTYSKQEGSDWVKQSTNNSLLDISSTNSVDPSAWKDFDFEKIDGGYVLSASMDKLKNSNMFDSFSGYLGDTTVSDFEIQNDGKIIYTFDKNCNLVRIETKDVLITGSQDMGEGLGSLTCDMEMNFKFDLSKFNELEPSDYEIPSKVIKRAVDASSGTNPLEQPTGGDENVNPTTPSEPEPTTEPKSNKKGSVTLNGADAQGQNNKYCFTVGQDIPAGTYKLYKVSGSGIFSVTDAKTFDQNYSFSIGYGLPDDTADGAEVILDTGDEIYITDQLVVELK